MYTGHVHFFKVCIFSANMLALIGSLFLLPFLIQAASLDGRIVNGIDVFIEDFPYQVSLQIYGMHLCGASIIGPKQILTAAHCTEGNRVDSLSIRVGSSFHSLGGKIIKVAKVIQHEDFILKVYQNDVSILILEEEITYGETAQPIGLTDEELPEGTDCDVTGWGYLKENGQQPKLLNQVVVPIISRATCREMYGQSRITEEMICAGFADGSHDACQGDSGGPLVHNGKQVGIVSWGIGCARPNRPGVYSNVAALRSWIRLHANI